VSDVRDEVQRQIGLFDEKGRANYRRVEWTLQKFRDQMRIVEQPEGMPLHYRLDPAWVDNCVRHVMSWEAVSLLDHLRQEVTLGIVSLGAKAEGLGLAILPSIDFVYFKNLDGIWNHLRWLLELLSFQVHDPVERGNSPPVTDDERIAMVEKMERMAVGLSKALEHAWRPGISGKPSGS
jgi:hypothetical protein